MSMSSHGKILNALFEMGETLERVGYDTDLRFKIKAYSKGYTSIENGKTYIYPELIEIKIENWSNHFLSMFQ